LKEEKTKVERPEQVRMYEARSTRIGQARRKVRTKQNLERKAKKGGNRGCFKTKFASCRLRKKK